MPMLNNFIESKTGISFVSYKVLQDKNKFSNHI